MNEIIQKGRITSGGIWKLQVQVSCVPVEPEKKVRLVAVFQSGDQDRRIPIPVNLCGEGCYRGEMEISLPDVFWKEIKTDIVNVEFELMYLDVFHRCQGPEIRLEGRWFRRKEEKEKKGAFYGLLFLICTLFLPFFLLYAWMLQKIKGSLDIGKNQASGLKAVIVYADHTINRLTGYTYSPRHNKGMYFAYYYKRCCKKYPLSGNHVLFLSERPKEAYGNLDCIERQFARFEEIEIEEFICTKTIDKLSLAQIREAAQKCAAARMIILEDFYPQIHNLSLREETKLVQLWHGCGAFKTFGYSWLGKAGGPMQSSKNHRNYDFTFVSGENIVPIYSEAFGIPRSHVLPYGVARTDVFFNQEYRAQQKQWIYQRLPQLKGKKVIVFAPTFRGNGNKDAYYPFEQVPFEEMLHAFPEDYAIVVKNHPFLQNRKKSYEPLLESDKARFMDVSQLCTLNQLLFVTDVLITDYSSSIFEAALLDIPMVFYAFDWEEYKKDRDIYNDYNYFVPGEIITEGGALGQAVKRACTPHTKSAKREDLLRFKQTYLEALDGNSSRRIAEFLRQLLFTGKL